MPQTVKVEGYREFIRACDKAGKETKRYVRESFRKVGDIVKDEARRDLGSFRHPVPQRTISGIRTIVRQRGVSVEQIRRKTTGLRPDWGATQMKRALIPALDDRENDVEREFEKAMDKVADHFDR